MKQIRFDTTNMKNNTKGDDLKVLINLKRKQLNHKKTIEKEL